MLNAHVGLVAVRDAHRHGAVVETPAIVERHERVEYEAAVTVAVWRKQQHAIARHLLQAANGMAQGIARGAFGASDNVFPVAIEHADMDMGANDRKSVVEGKRVA